MGCPSGMKKLLTNRAETRVSKGFTSANDEDFLSNLGGYSGRIKVQILEAGKILCGIFLLNIGPVLRQYFQ